MKFARIFTICLVLCVLLSEMTSIKKFSKLSTRENGPVIGVLASPNPSNPPEGSTEEKKGTEEIAQVDLNYIHWLQKSGARVIPILPWFTTEELDARLAKINGVVFQGGSMKYSDKKDYFKTGLHILDHAHKNKNFVVWGICNGFQMINHWAFDRTGKKNPNYKNDPLMETLLLPAQANENYQSKILAALSHENRENMLKNPSTAHFHSYSVNKNVMNDEGYNKLLNVAAFATNPGKKTDSFINIIEGNGSKIYGTQFHPEKMLNVFYKKTQANPNGVLEDHHDGKYFDEGTAISTALGKFLVQQATSKEYASNESLKEFQLIPDIKSAIDSEVKAIEAKKKNGQINKDGIAVLSCGRFSYSWYSKGQKDATKYKFKCVSNGGQA